MEHLELIKRVAARLSRRLPPHLAGELYFDLISYGTIGLLRARAKFDPNLGKFEDYAATKIRYAILDGLRNLHPFPRHYRKTHQEAKVVPLENVERITHADPASRALVLDLLGCLTPGQRAAVELYYFKHMTMLEIGKRLGVSESAICLRIKSALRRMRR